MSDKQPADKQPTDRHPTERRAADRQSLDERRRADMQVSPSREEMEAAHKERLAMIDNPPPPIPSQEEADAMKMGAYEQPGDQGQHGAREGRDEQRDRESQDQHRAQQPTGTVNPPRSTVTPTPQPTHLSREEEQRRQQAAKDEEQRRHPQQQRDMRPQQPGADYKTR